MGLYNINNISSIYFTLKGDAGNILEQQDSATKLDKQYVVKIPLKNGKTTLIPAFAVVPDTNGQFPPLHPKDINKFFLIKIDRSTKNLPEYFKVETEIFAEEFKLQDEDKTLLFGAVRSPKNAKLQRTLNKIIRTYAQPKSVPAKTTQSRRQTIKNKCTHYKAPLLIAALLGSAGALSFAAKGLFTGNDLKPAANNNETGINATKNLTYTDFNATLANASNSFFNPTADHTAASGFNRTLPNATYNQTFLVGHPQNITAPQSPFTQEPSFLFTNLNTSAPHLENTTSPLPKTQNPHPSTPPSPAKANTSAILSAAKTDRAATIANQNRHAPTKQEERRSSVEENWGPSYLTRKQFKMALTPQDLAEALCIFDANIAARSNIKSTLDNALQDTPAPQLAKEILEVKNNASLSLNQSYNNASKVFEQISSFNNATCQAAARPEETKKAQDALITYNLTQISQNATGNFQNSTANKLSTGKEFCEALFKFSSPNLSSLAAHFKAAKIDAVARNVSTDASSSCNPSEKATVTISTTEKAKAPSFSPKQTDVEQFNEGLLPLKNTLQMKQGIENPLLKEYFDQQIRLMHLIKRLIKEGTSKEIQRVLSKNNLRIKLRPHIKTIADDVLQIMKKMEKLDTAFHVNYKLESPEIPQYNAARNQLMNHIMSMNEVDEVADALVRLMDQLTLYLTDKDNEATPQMCLLDFHSKLDNTLLSVCLSNTGSEKIPRLQTMQNEKDIIENWKSLHASANNIAKGLTALFEQMGSATPSEPAISQLQDILKPLFHQRADLQQKIGEREQQMLKHLRTLQKLSEQKNIHVLSREQKDMALSHINKLKCQLIEKQESALKTPGTLAGNQLYHKAALEKLRASSPLFSQLILRKIELAAMSEDADSISHVVQDNAIYNEWATSQPQDVQEKAESYRDLLNQLKLLLSLFQAPQEMNNQACKFMESYSSKTLTRDGTHEIITNILSLLDNLSSYAIERDGGASFPLSILPNFKDGLTAIPVAELFLATDSYGDENLKSLKFEWDSTSREAVELAEKMKDHFERTDFSQSSYEPLEALLETKVQKLLDKINTLNQEIAELEKEAVSIIEMAAFYNAMNPFRSSPEQRAEDVC